MGSDSGGGGGGVGSVSMQRQAQRAWSTYERSHRGVQQRCDRPPAAHRPPPADRVQSIITPPGAASIPSLVAFVVARRASDVFQGGNCDGLLAQHSVGHLRNGRRTERGGESVEADECRHASRCVSLWWVSHSVDSHFTICFIELVISKFVVLSLMVSYSSQSEASRRLASQREAPRRLASQPEASRRLAPQPEASRRLASQREASRCLASQREASRRLALQREAPRRLASQRLSARAGWHGRCACFVITVCDDWRVPIVSGAVLQIGGGGVSSRVSIGGEFFPRRDCAPWPRFFLRNVSNRLAERGSLFRGVCRRAPRCVPPEWRCSVMFRGLFQHLPDTSRQASLDLHPSG